MPGDSDNDRRGLLPRTEREAASLRPKAATLGVPPAGTVIASRYIVENVIGAGGMGVVLAARHVHLGQRVAIKFMRGDACADPVAVRRFLREARAAVALSSEHVAKVIDFGTLETGEPYTVMEYLSGCDLAEVLRRHGRLPISDAVGIVLQACEAIAEAHSIGIVHRDLKPANLFVTEQTDGAPLVKVLDFGISKMATPNQAEASESLTSTGLVMGSPGYMSPEQVRNSKAVDGRSDIWAVGVILYELLSGVSPFRGDTAGEIFARIVTETPPPLSAVRTEIPDGLAKAVAQCLERELGRRVQSVSDLASKLLPFAPPEARLSVDRIHRVARASSGPRLSAETLDAPGTPAHGPGGKHDVGETEPPWLKSGTLASPGRPTLRRRSIASLAGLTAIVLVVGAGFCARRGPFRKETAEVSPAPQHEERALSAAPAIVAPPVGTTGFAPTAEISATEGVDAGVRSVQFDRKARTLSAPTKTRTTMGSGPAFHAPLASAVAPALPRPEQTPAAGTVFELRE